MKLPAVFLALSLLANAGLSYVVWSGFIRTSIGTGSGKDAAESSFAADTLPRDETSIEQLIGSQLAQAIKSDDPHLLREALRAAGFPDSYVRDMVTFQIGNSVSPERLALLREEAEKPYWTNQLTERGQELRRMFHETDEKNRELAKSVFDGKVPPHPLEAMNQQRRYQFLPADKIESVVRIDQDYSELQSEIFRTTRAGSPEAREKLSLLAQEQRADLAKVLTPAELELRDLHLSPSAQLLRTQLTYFQPTEKEFRALYQLRSSLDDKSGWASGAIGSTPPEQRAANERAAYEQARVLLGERRFAEYERAQDEGYRAAMQIIAHYNLPATKAAETYTFQKATQQRAQEIRKSAGADQVASEAALKALAAEANARLTELLGSAGADAYRKTGGSWLQTLERPRE